MSPVKESNETVAIVSSHFTLHRGSVGGKERSWWSDALVWISVRGLESSYYDVQIWYVSNHDVGSVDTNAIIEKLTRQGRFWASSPISVRHETRSRLRCIYMSRLRHWGNQMLSPLSSHNYPRTTEDFCWCWLTNNQSEIRSSYNHRRTKGGF